MMLKATICNEGTLLQDYLGIYEANASEYLESLLLATCILMISVAGSHHLICVTELNLNACRQCITEIDLSKQMLPILKKICLIVCHSYFRKHLPSCCRCATGVPSDRQRDAYSLKSSTLSGGEMCGGATTYTYATKLAAQQEGIYHQEHDFACSRLLGSK